MGVVCSSDHQRRWLSLLKPANNVCSGLHLTGCNLPVTEGENFEQSAIVSRMPRQVALPVAGRVGVGGLASSRGVGGLEGSAPGALIIGNLSRLLAKHHCRVAVLSLEAVACEGRVVSQGAGDRIEIVPCACIFRAVELPEIACGPGQILRAGFR